MVLLINGIVQKEVPSDSRCFYTSHPEYRETASQFRTMPTKQVGPAGLLYVQQREMAATQPHDENVGILGSDDATTCVIVVLRHSGSGAIALAHLDGTGTKDAVSLMIQRVSELALSVPEGRLEIQLIGGYSDPKNCSEELFHFILSVFHKHPLEIYLTLCCVGEMNTKVRDDIHWPVIYGIGVDVKTGEIFPATFQDKGPDQSLRSARSLTGGEQVIDVYDSTLGLLKIGPFNYHSLPRLDLWLAAPDQYILKHLSTSPDVEPPHFAAQMRATLKFIQDNQFPTVTVFPDNRPHYYRRDEATGIWQLTRH